MSMMSHLSVDPAALAHASMIHHNHLDTSQFGGLDQSKIINDDRYQIVQWHLNQIQTAKDQVEEAQRQLDHSKQTVERLEETLSHKDLEKINKEEEDRQLKN